MLILGCWLDKFMHVVDVRKGIQSKTLLQYSSLTPLERGCYEGEVQPYRKTECKQMMMMGADHHQLIMPLISKAC